MKFNEWLSGLIDGDGCFLLSQKGYCSLEITMDIRDERCLSIVKKRYGGSLKLRSGSKSIRYRLHHKSGLILLLKDVNGLIRHSTRLIQYNKLITKYQILSLDMVALSFNSNWMAGFLDAEGTITINSKNYQMAISISQKTQELLKPLVELYGGYVYIDRSSCTFKWYVTKKETILFLVDNYFKNNYIYSLKKNRLFMLKEYYRLMGLKKQDNPLFEKTWVLFYKKWINYDKVKDMYQNKSK